MPDKSSSSATSKYAITFPMFAKIDVNGSHAHPLFEYLKNAKSGLLGASIKWNFTKFLVDRSGKVVARHAPTAKPEGLTKRNRGAAMNEKNETMSDQFPDRLSTNPKSPYYNEELLSRDVGIRFKGAEKTNVEEYCISEGWVRVTAGNAKDRYGNPLTIKVHGPVEPYFRDKTES